jgi:hypothetical protein
MTTHRILVLGLLLLVVGSDQVAPAQSTLDRLERQIRQRDSASANENPQTPPSSRPSTPSSEAANAEPGYLGVLADDQRDRGRGVRILEVYLGGPAEKAGLRGQDLLTALAGVRVRQMSDLSDMLAVLPPGQKVEIELIRDQRPLKLQITMGRYPAEKRAQSEHPAAGQAGEGPEVIPPPRGEAISPPASIETDSRLIPPQPSIPPMTESARIEQLQRRVEALERRIEELERLSAETHKKQS